MVTPFVGVWIETLLGGLFGKSNTVTPFVGVWIETRTGCFNAGSCCVTPFVGVWIETCPSRYTQTASESHTLRGCVD